MLLIGQALEHANKTVRSVADMTFKEFAADPNHSTGVMPTRLDVIENRWRKQGWHDGSNAIDQSRAEAEFGIRTPSSSDPFSLSSESEPGGNPVKADSNTLSSESELSLKSASFSAVRIPNSYSTYTNTNTSVCKSSVPHDPVPGSEELPLGFERFTQEQRIKAATLLQRVEPNLRKPVVDQWQHRCKSGTVNNPFGYLLSCIQKAYSGDFNAQWQAPAAAKNSSTVSVNAPKSSQPTSASYVDAPTQPITSPSPALVTSRLLKQDEARCWTSRSWFDRGLRVEHVNGGSFW